MTGRLEIQGSPGLVSLDWNAGKILRVSTDQSGRRLIDYVVEMALTDADALSALEVDRHTDETTLIQAIVGQGRPWPTMA